MKRKATAALALALAMSTVLGGCGTSADLDPNATIATLDDSTGVTLGEFNLYLRYQQAQMEYYYASLFGTQNIYSQDMYGTGEIYGETAKETLVENFNTFYVLEAEAPNYGVELSEDEQAAITEAAGSFIEANTEDTLNALGVDQNSAERLLTLLTISEKMYDVLTADVDTEVSDEEAAQKSISYLYISTDGTETDGDGNTIELTDEEKAEKKELLQTILDEAAESGDLDAAAENHDLSAIDTTYGANSTTPIEEVRTAADALEEGEVSDIIEVDGGYYGVMMVSTFDEEATQTEKESIIQDRMDDLYTEQCETLAANHTFTTNNDVMALLTFDRVYTIDSTTSE